MLAVFRGLRADLSNTVGRLLREAFPPAPHFSLAGVYGSDVHPHGDSGAVGAQQDAGDGIWWMAVPKKRTTLARRHKRRSLWARAPHSGVKVCLVCRGAALRHHLCPNCLGKAQLETVKVKEADPSRYGQATLFPDMYYDLLYFGKKKPTEEDRAKAEKIKNTFLRTQEKKAHRDEKRDSF